MYQIALCSKNIKQHWGFKLQGCNSVHTKHMHPVQACSCPEESHCVDCALNTLLWNWDKWDLCFSTDSRRVLESLYNFNYSNHSFIWIDHADHHAQWNIQLPNCPFWDRKYPRWRQRSLGLCPLSNSNKSNKKFFGFCFFFNCISYNSKISNCCYRQTEPVKLWSSRLEVSGEKLLLDTVI